MSNKEPLLFDIILSRTAKEFNFYNKINHNYDRQKMLKYVKRLDLHDDIFSIYSILFDNKIIYDNKCSYSEIESFISKFDNILIELIKKPFIKFLSSNMILNTFNYNLKNGEPVGMLKKQPNNIDEYFDILIENNMSLFDVVMYSFVWRDTKQEYDFWEKIDNKYKILIFNILFNNIYVYD